LLSASSRGDSLATVRVQLGKAADALGVRASAVRAREHVISLLTGGHAHADLRRNSRDDFHLKLLLRFGLRPTSNYLDVGANQGHFLKGIQALAPLGHHIAYEPLPHLCVKLSQRFPGVEVRQAALSDTEGEAPFIHVLGAGNQGYSNLADGGLKTPAYRRELPTETIIVRTERLDDHLPEGWLPQFVKIDVEGAERLVIKGASETFRRAKPVIAFEHQWDPEGSDEMYDLICTHLGLRLFDMDGHGPLSRSEFFDGLRSRWNWIAHE
jgi:FkbM family methyltransferase